MTRALQEEEFQSEFAHRLLGTWALIGGTHPMDGPDGSYS